LSQAGGWLTVVGGRPLYGPARGARIPPPLAGELEPQKRGSVPFSDLGVATKKYFPENSGENCPTKSSVPPYNLKTP